MEKYGKPKEIVMINKIVLIIIGITLLLIGIWIGKNQVVSEFSMELPEESELYQGISRFTFSPISQFYKDQFLLDTITGRVWNVRKSGETGKNILESVSYLGFDGSYTTISNYIMYEVLIQYNPLYRKKQQQELDAFIKEFEQIMKQQEKD